MVLGKMICTAQGTMHVFHTATGSAMTSISSGSDGKSMPPDERLSHRAPMTTDTVTLGVGAHSMLGGRPALGPVSHAAVQGTAVPTVRCLPHTWCLTGCSVTWGCRYPSIPLSRRDSGCFAATCPSTRRSASQYFCDATVV